MEQNQCDIIILKPTFVFLSFLAAQAQIPETDLPKLHQLQADTTAFAIQKKKNDEETLDEIERYFPRMFKHEITRWIGDSGPDEIEASFLDFLCCFKFEIHSQIVLMEPSITDGYQLLILKPRSVLLKWIRSAAEDRSDINAILERVNLAHLSENTTVVVKNFKKSSDVKSFIKQYYYPLYITEMSRMSDKAHLWPVVDSFQKFNQYFTVELHTKLIHLIG